MGLYQLLITKKTIKKMKNLKYIVVFAVLIASGKLFAQQEPSYTMYQYNMNVINPAYVGSSGEMDLNMHIRTQWTDIDGAPETQSFAFSTPINNKIGIGFSVVNDKYDITKETSYTADFSYKVQLSDNSDLYLGVKAGAYSLNIDFLSKGIIGDPLFSKNVNRTNALFGAGAYLKMDKFYATLSIPNFLSGERVKSSNDYGYEATDKVHIYAGAGYTFDLGEHFDLTPSFMARFVEGSPVSVDLTATADIYNTLEIGASYRWDNSISGIALIKASDWLQFGYAYEHTTTDLGDYSGGTHEIMLRFHLNHM